MDVDGDSLSNGDEIAETQEESGNVATAEAPAKPKKPKAGVRTGEHKGGVPKGSKKVNPPAAAKLSRKPDRTITAHNQRTADTFKLVSDPTRIAILKRLNEEGEVNVGAICVGLNQSQPAVSHHLALLRHGGLVSPRRDGKSNFYGLTKMGSTLAKTAESVGEKVNTND